jgi:DNA-binding MarR family transcriptional regulator
MGSFRGSLGMRLRAAYLAMHRTFQEHFAPHGLTADQFVVLSLLAEEDGIIQKELVRRTYSDPNTVTAILRLLEKKRLVRRVRPDHDGRARCVYLTPAGRLLRDKLARSSAELHRRLYQAVPAEASAEFHGLLAAITETMASLRRSRSQPAIPTRRKT